MQVAKFLSAGFFVTAFSSHMAAADLTAEDIWVDLSTYALIFGGELKGDVSKSDATQTVSNMYIEFQLTADSAMILELGELQIVELGDGRVELVYPEEQVITLKGSDGEQGDTIAMKVIRRDHVMLASGFAGSVTYESTATQFGFDILEIVTSDEKNNEKDVDIQFLSEGYASKTEVSTQNGIDLRHSANHGSIRYHVFTQESREEQTRVSIEATDATTFYAVSNPESSIGWSDFVSAVKEGLSLEFGFRTGPSSVDATFRDAETEEIQLVLKGESGRSKYSMTKNGWGYSTSSQGIKFSIPDVDSTILPIEGTVESVELDALIPVLSSDTAQDMIWRGNVSNLSMSDTFWEQFEPSGTMVRDSLSLEFDTTLKWKVSKGMFEVSTSRNGQEAERLSMLPIGLDIDSLKAYALGVAFSGSGSFSFDNSDM